MKRGVFLHVLFCILSILAPPRLAASQGDSAVVPDTTAVADSVLLRQLEQELAVQTDAVTPAPPPRTSGSTNPDISALGDVRALYRTPAERHFDFEFHEAEFAFKSVVDPYARAEFYLSLAPDPVDGSFSAEIEEAYLVSLALPLGLQLKAGQFRSAFGRINPIHPHALPFISMPDVYTAYLGEEGLKDAGVSVSWLVPNPLDFYQELTFEFTTGPTKNPSFSRSETDHFLYLGHLKNFWDLTENATLELGFSGAAGPNDSSGTTLLGGIDCTYKWKPLRENTYQSFVLQAEAIFSNKGDPSGPDVRSWGAYLLGSYQLDQRLFLTGRFDYSNLPDNAAFVSRSYSGTLGWLATEFQKLEIEFRRTTSNVLPASNEITLRSIFIIGTHGAHTY